MAFPPIISDDLQVGVTKLIEVWGQSTMTTTTKKIRNIMFKEKIWDFSTQKYILKV